MMDRGEWHAYEICDPVLWNGRDGDSSARDTSRWDVGDVKQEEEQHLERRLIQMKFIHIYIH